jgi:Undecaprenyl-phosphate galactose phosphotransferase WbaP
MANWSLNRNEAIQDRESESRQPKPREVTHARSPGGGSGALADAEIVQFPVRSAIQYPSASVLKRALDLLGGVLFLLALLPVMVAIALLVKRDGGPILFRHKRIGANGKPFSCLKFRTMCVDAEERLQKLLAENPEARAEWERDFKLKNDPRVTSLGNFMRQTSLDELPQLFNVIRGEMSLVGPRPIVTAEAARYGAAFRDYLGCRPGLTGLWQVSGRNDIDYDSRVQLDSTYAREWSLTRDVAILVRTVGVVFGRTGAY